MDDVAMMSHAPIMHIASQFGKCLLHHKKLYAEEMDTICNRLKAARVKAGYETAKSAADILGVPVATYIQHENGSRGIPKDKIERYARFFRISPEWLTFGVPRDSAHETIGPSLFVKGEVAAGVWREAWEFQADEWEMFTGRADISTPIRQRFGLRVVGDSMNEIYPPGSIVECVAYDSDDPIPAGKRVIVRRERFDGTFETTVKELQLDDQNNVWLVPRSTNPIFQAPFQIDSQYPDLAKIEIIGIVVSSIRPE